ncbi:MAG: DEAD/DEAH box helicase family protein [Saprospiraceae bacterium]|nr:DEAD/DEAH box helicase family protein [Saprospiraceae bacterium]
MQDSNFHFLSGAWSVFAETAREAEQNALLKPMYAAVLCRKSAEQWVQWLYQNDPDLTLPYNTTFNALLHQSAFKNLLAPDLFHALDLIRRTGNNAAHAKARIQPGEALLAVRKLHRFACWTVRLYSESAPDIPDFNSDLVPQADPAQAVADKTRAELQALEARWQQESLTVQAALEEQEKRIRELVDQLAQARVRTEAEQMRARKARNAAQLRPLPPDPDEATTRTVYINQLLREAGWDPFGLNVEEYKLPTGQRADYVLWGDDGKPLAVVEAKRSRRDADEGRQQGKLYADALERLHGQRPVIFYTNGFETFLWDDTHYPPRRVQGYYNKAELQTLLHRRSSRRDLRREALNEQIAGRPYQIEAQRAIAEAFHRGERGALLVMATGTGKTRTAAALVDMLSKAGWVKRVLFLADRNALLTQAKNAFNTQLPNLPAVDLTKEKETDDSRVVFSTYQTLINKIDGEFEGDQRHFGVGYFDLVIFDEIHRSVYNRYQTIFHYFDGLRVGLTATPRSETDRDTYRLFGLEPQNPTFAYELDRAVDDRHLVPPRAIGVPFRFQRQGIKYSELSPEEQREYEEKLADPVTGAFPSEIDAPALNAWLFNEDTVDKAIGYLMENGIKVEGGDKLGKTIIFARNHAHARFITDRFDKQYPNLAGHFCQVVDNYSYDAQAQIWDFSDTAKMPQIAVSVDMLDTGIDVPEAVNLVFYKPVRSSSKFWQMIGRGTRLCPDLFGSGQHKTHFLIFDFCENFEFFGMNPKGIETGRQKSLSAHLFGTRLALSQLLGRQSDTDQQAFGDRLLQDLIEQVQALDGSSFVVRQHWQYVEKYRDPNRWNALTVEELREINQHLAPLMSDVHGDESAKRFDLLLLQGMQQALLAGGQLPDGLSAQVSDMAANLTKKASIPVVADKMALLRAVQTKEYWQAAGPLTLENLREDMRPLIRFLDKKPKPAVFTDFEDAMDGDVMEHNLFSYQVNDLNAYRTRVQQFLYEHRQHLSIHKLTHNIPITTGELSELERMLLEQSDLGSREDFEKAFGTQPLGALVRSMLGLDAEAARAVFAEFLATPGLNTPQIRFVDLIIRSLTINGVVDPAQLFAPPFTDVHTGGLTVFDDRLAGKVVDLLEGVRRNAGVA